MNDKTSPSDPSDFDAASSGTPVAATPGPLTRRANRRRRIFIGLGLLLGIVAVTGGGYWWTQSRNQPALIEKAPQPPTPAEAVAQALAAMQTATPLWPPALNTNGRPAKTDTAEDDTSEDAQAGEDSDAPLPPTAKYDDQLSNSLLEILDIEIADKDLAPIEGNPEILQLHIDAGRITDEGIPSIVSLPNLIELRLRKSPIGDAGLAALADSPNMQNLQILNLPQAACTASGILELKKLKRLRNLRLGSLNARPEIVHAIVQLESLRAIHLIDIPITDAGLKILANMPRLDSLYIDGAAVTEGGWEWVFQNHPEIHIHINQEHHDHDPHRHEHK